VSDDETRSQADRRDHRRPQMLLACTHPTPQVAAQFVCRDLVVAAWHEALGLTVPSADELQKQTEQAESDKASLREVMLAELHGGPAGVKIWNDRSDEERAKIGKLRKADFTEAKLSDAKLSGIDFHGAQFQDATMKKAHLDGCVKVGRKRRLVIELGAVENSLGTNVVLVSGVDDSKKK
jgi:hypothetical protein